MSVGNSQTRTHIHTYAHTHTHTHTYTYTHTHTHTHTHLRTHIHTHIHTYAHTHTYTHTHREQCYSVLTSTLGQLLSQDHTPTPPPSVPLRAGPPSPRTEEGAKDPQRDVSVACMVLGVLLQLLVSMFNNVTTKHTRTTHISLSVSRDADLGPEVRR